MFSIRGHLESNPKIAAKVMMSSGEMSQSELSEMSQTGEPIMATIETIMPEIYTVFCSTKEVAKSAVEDMKREMAGNKNVVECTLFSKDKESQTMVFKYNKQVSVYMPVTQLTYQNSLSKFNELVIGKSYELFVKMNDS